MLKGGFLCLWRRLGRPRNSNHSNSSRMENAVSLNLAMIIEEKKWLGDRYIRGFGFCENPETLYSTYHKYNVQPASRPNEGQSSLSVKNVALFRKTCFRGVKTRVMGTLFSLKIKKKGSLLLWLEFFGGQKAPQRAQNSSK